MPAPTLRLLLTRYELGLTLLTAADALPESALDTPVSWVHGSDLADPTPFLSEGQVLLTTGTQFGTASETDPRYDDYVARLVDCGVVGLGYGTEVIRDTPLGLVDACLAAGLPLIEVPYRTPFIAVSRYAADLVAQQAYARTTWSLAAQRALSLAALRPDGLTATLDELARQLGRWVVLVDAAGVVTRSFPVREVDGSVRETVQREAARMLRARRRAAATVAEGGTVITLQTLGASDRLLGVLAHGGHGDIDEAAQQVVTSVVALAGLALDQERELERARVAARHALQRALDDAQRLASDLGDAAGLPVGTAAELDRARANLDAMLARSATGGASARVAAASARPAEVSLLPSPGDADARARASAILAPLVARDPGGDLVDTLRVWLERNGVYDAAARDLGVHRHTVTARVRSVEQALGRDLDDFATRAELWTALRITAPGR